MSARFTLRRRGFTLVEVLLSSMIMSLLALSLFATLRIGLRARDSALSGIGPARSVQLAMELARKDLENAMSPSGLFAGPFIGDNGTAVNGTSQLEFYAVGRGIRANRAADLGAAAEPDPEWDGADPTTAAGIHRVQLLVLPSTQLSADQRPLGLLVRRTTRNLLSPNAAAESANAASAPELLPEDEILCRGVRSFLVRYLGYTEGYTEGATPQWTDAWNSTQMGDILPMAVEITIELDRPTGTAALSAAAEQREVDAGTVYKVTRTFFLACHRETADPQVAAQAALAEQAATGTTPQQGSSTGGSTTGR